MTRKRWVIVAAVGLVAAAGATFGILWSSSGARALPLSVAYQHYHAGQSGGAYAHETLRPRQGVYAYSGSGSEHLSLPPKTQSEGPVIPGTVTYLAGGCWRFRLDFNDRHWQDATYCPRASGLDEAARAGYYDWNFVFTNESDTASYSCRPVEAALSTAGGAGVKRPFSCIGKNAPLSIPPVTMAGTTEMIRTGTVSVAGQRLPAVEMREVASFSGGQTGTDYADTWFDTETGLPLTGSWSTVVRTSTPIGTSTLTAGGRFVLQSLDPRT